MSRQVYSRNRNSTGRKRVLRASGKSPELHCMVVPTDPEILLLPTSVMCEVVDYKDIAPIEDAPPWLMGQVQWENRQVPVFSFSGLINGKDVQAPGPRAKVMIIKSLAESGRVPYLGLLLGDLPRPVKVNDGDLQETGDEKKAMGVFSRVRIGDEEDAIIPDIDRLTHLVTHATYGALPITQLD
ncbi:MAG: chemotaxis protein CheW [Lysobacterales bacterium]|jgi:chemosensory pili system protein ChpC